MRYLVTLFIALFIISCALEKEETDSLKAKFAFTIASIQMDNISGISMPAEKRLCIPSSSSYVFKYTAFSNGLYGTDVESLIRNSYIESLSTKLYFYYDCKNGTNCSNISTDINKLPNLQYNKSVNGSTDIDIASHGIVEDKEYLVSILVYGRERNGEGTHTGDNQFGSDFGTVVFSRDCSGFN